MNEKGGYYLIGGARRAVQALGVENEGIMMMKVVVAVRLI